MGNAGGIVSGIRPVSPKELRIDVPRKSVYAAGIDVQLRRHTGLHERRGVGDRFVEKDVHAADGDVGRRQAPEIGRARRRRIGRYGAAVQ